MLPPVIRFGGGAFKTDEFLSSTDTVAMLVLKDGEIVSETYSLSGRRDVRWLSMSVAKSVVPAPVDAAVAAGTIRSIDKFVTRYLPNLWGSGYDGVSIRDVLQMCSDPKLGHFLSSATPVRLYAPPRSFRGDDVNLIERYCSIKGCGSP